MAAIAPVTGPIEPGKNRSERTGFSPADELPVTRPGGASERPPRPAWISDALLAETVNVWSQAYGRTVSEDEAVEILTNVGRLAEALLNAQQETCQ